MTDKEIALALGVRIFAAKLSVEAANSELHLSRENQSLGRLRQVHQIVDESRDQVHQPVYSERIEELDRKLSASAPDELLQTLRMSLDEMLGKYDWYSSGHTPV